jgi:hypothetical protein
VLHIHDLIEAGIKWSNKQKIKKKSHK